MEVEVGHLYRNGPRPVSEFVQTYRFIVTHNLPIEFYATGYLWCGVKNKIWKFGTSGKNMEYSYEVDPSILKPEQKHNLVKAIFGTWGI